MIFYCFLITATDAVVALAEASYGSVDNFVSHMNKKARELKLNNTNFKNPHGLDDADHYSSARDMALIARELVKHEKIFTFTSVYEDYLRQNTDKKIWLVNTNKLVRFYDGVDGLKTGYTSSAGYCITATAKRDGMRIIAVVMGEPTSKLRNKEISEMFDYAFAQYETQNLLQNKSLGKYKIINGRKKTAKIIPKEEVKILKKKGENDLKVKLKVELLNLTAPIKKGDRIGKLTIKKDNKLLRNVELTIEENVDKINFVKLLLRNVEEVLTGKL